MILSAAKFMFFLVLFCAAFHCCQSRADVRAFVTDFTSTVNKQRQAAALQWVDDVETLSAKHGVDPLLVAVMVACESSWNADAIGKRGEVGLMQVMPNNKILVGIDRSNPVALLDAGIGFLRFCIDQTETLEEALSLYATGKKQIIKKAVYRARLYETAKERFR